MDAILSQICKTLKDGFLTHLWEAVPALETELSLMDAKSRFDEWANSGREVPIGITSSKKATVAATKRAAAATKKLSEPKVCNVDDAAATEVATSTAIVCADGLPFGYAEFRLPALKDLCRLRKLPVSGTRGNCIGRLEKYHNINTNESDDNIVVSATKEAVPPPSDIEEKKIVKKPSGKKSDKKAPPPPTVDEKPKKGKKKAGGGELKVKPIVPVEGIRAEYDEFGQLFDPKTGLVFNEDQEAVGVKDSEGNVKDLTPELLDYCRMHNISYVVPDELVEVFDEVTQTESEDEEKINATD